MEDEQQAHGGEQGAYEPAHPGEARHARAVRARRGMGDAVKEGHAAHNEFQKGHGYEIVNHYLPVLAFVPVLTQLPAERLPAVILLRIVSGCAGLFRLRFLAVHNLRYLRL